MSGLRLPVPARRPATLPVGRVALLSVHTSPLAQPGTGDGGGLNVYVLEVARRLARRGVTVDVFTRADSPAAPPSVALAEGLVVHHLRAGPRRPVAKAALLTHLCEFTLRLLAHPTAGSHDLVHAHYWMSGWVGRRAADRWGIPLVHTFHTLGVAKNAARAPGDPPEPPVRLAAERRLAAVADRLLVLTCGEARLLHRTFGIGGARLAVVPAGVDTEVFSPTLDGDPGGPARAGGAGERAPALITAPAGGDAPAAAQHRGGWGPPARGEGHHRTDPARRRRGRPAGDPELAFGSDPAGPLLLFVGRLQPLKGPDLAIRTLAEVRRSLPARLLVVGGTSGTGSGRSGPEELAALAARLGVGGEVRILPARPQRELARLYRAADAVVVPSRTETFGLVALEAQACGTPVVAARVDGLSAVVRGGTLVTGHDPADHAAAALTYLTDPVEAARAGRAGRRWAVECSWERTVDRLLGAWEGLLEGPARRCSA